MVEPDSIRHMHVAAITQENQDVRSIKFLLVSRTVLSVLCMFLVPGILMMTVASSSRSSSSSRRRRHRRRRRRQ